MLKNTLDYIKIKFFTQPKILKLKFCKKLIINHFEICLVTNIIHKNKKIILAMLKIWYLFC